MGMTKERAGEIGIALAQRLMMDQAINFADLGRKTGRFAKDIGATKEEVTAFFVLHILPYLVAQGLGVSGTMELKHQRSSGQSGQGGHEIC